MNSKRQIISLNEESLGAAVVLLCKQDPVLESVVNQFGRPPLWDRDPGFATLVHIILEQQVSLASARACFDKLNHHLGQVKPTSFLELSDEALLSIGFSRQKTRYSRILASAILEGSLDLSSLSQLDDSVVFNKLTALTGIGPWTAKIYLLMALRRPDIWPGGDLALLVALKELYDLEKRPSPATFEKLGDSYMPYRAVAARILWHYYLSR